MKTIKVLALVLVVSIIASCSSNNNDIDLAVEAVSIENVYAPAETDYTQQPPVVSGEYIKFDFDSGSLTTSDTDWDVAFRGTTIIVNGGVASGAVQEPSRSGNAAVYIATGTIASVSDVDVSMLEQDDLSGFAITPGSGNGWYTYAGPPTHVIAPTAGKILVFRTTENKYVKMEILSYYKDAPSSPTGTEESDYYTFNYVYNPNVGVTSFE